jgi:hypothetical protein
VDGHLVALGQHLEDLVAQVRERVEDLLEVGAVLVGHPQVSDRGDVLDPARRPARLHGVQVATGGGVEVGPGELGDRIGRLLLRGRHG